MDIDVRVYNWLVGWFSAPPIKGGASIRQACHGIPNHKDEFILAHRGGSSNPRGALHVIRRTCRWSGRQDLREP